MNKSPCRWLLVTIFTLVTAVACSPEAAPPAPSSPVATSASPSPPTPAGRSAVDYVALEAEIEKAITGGTATLDNVRAVLVNVDGETKIAHYRHGFTEKDHGHVFSVTKSVLSILIGIAIDDGLIADIDQPLIELLPKHRQALSGDTAKVTLRHLMTMSGGFNDEFPGGFVWEKAAEPGNSFIDVLLDRRQKFEPGATFWYSDTSAHLVAAVLAAALIAPMATVPVRFWTMPGRSCSIHWASRPAQASPGHFLIHSSRRVSSLPTLVGESTPMASSWARTACGSLRRTCSRSGSSTERGGVWNDQQIVPARGSNSAPHRRHTNHKSAVHSSTASCGGFSLTLRRLDQKIPSRLDTPRMGSVGNTSTCCRNREQ